MLPRIQEEPTSIREEMMREKFDTQLACGVTSEVKREVELQAASEGLSMADYTRRAVLRELRARKQEPADAA